MRNGLFFLVCLISFQHTASASEDWKITIGGVVRDIIVTAPSGYPNGEQRICSGLR